METETFMGKELMVGNKPGHEKLPYHEDETVERLGRELVKGYSEIVQNESWLSRSHKKRIEDFFESFGALKEGESLDNLKTEDMTFPNNSALYTTVVRAVVERAFRPVLVANEVIKTISINPSGTEKLKIPLNALRTASDLPDSGDLPSPDNDDYSDSEISLKWIYAYEVITLQIIRQGIIDIVQDQMFELGDALSRKVDSDILEAFQDAAPSDDSNSNYKDAGSEVTYEDLVDGVFGMQENEAIADAIVTTPSVWKEFVKTSDVKGTYKFSTVDAGSIFPRVLDFYGVRVYLTTNANTGNLFLVDSGKCGYLIEGSGIEMLDGRKSGTVNWEVIALKLYGVKVVKPKSVYRLTVTGFES
ncbi:MAG: hypothetical protein ACOCTT_01910 [archaeon]